MLVLITGLCQVPALLAAPASAGVLSLAEKPVQLLRGVTLYQAPLGTHLQGTDLIESDQSNVQIDGLAGIRLALGPHTRIYVQRTSNGTDIALLQGWLKLQPVTGAKPEHLTVTTAQLTLDVSRSASVIHADGRHVEVFVEDGTQTLIERNRRGQEGRKTTLKQEEYTQRNGDDPLSAAGRPDSGFIKAMPPAFFDPLPAVSLKKLPNAPLVKVRDVTFDDAAPLLLGAVTFKGRSMAIRFSPRLSDSAFRQAVVQHFGGSLDWETELYRYERKRATPEGRR
ncbi:hypothetical protein [Pseudomonas sp. UBA1879]|uniref:hypothetical protein n=1 Tax=Pseudomonas sp. UBA1879 TaxID=1947305 RepID=UPI0025F3D1E6|nr:hypothetical protein [Pseudomonas sp. UBA1879]